MLILALREISFGLSVSVAVVELLSSVLQTVYKNNKRNTYDTNVLYRSRLPVFRSPTSSVIPNKLISSASVSPPVKWGVKIYIIGSVRTIAPKCF